MPTFFDERGDTGKIGTTNSQFFQVAGVCFESADFVIEFELMIRDLRQKLGLKADFEFKFSRSHNHPERLEAFFNAALKIPFCFGFHSLDKTAVENQKLSGHKMWDQCATGVASAMEPVYRNYYESRGKRRLNEKLVLDNTCDATQLQIFKKAFRAVTVCNTPLVKLSVSAHYADSRSEVGIQLADMVVGACGLAVEGKSHWYEKICDRDVNKK